MQIVSTPLETRKISSICHHLNFAHGVVKLKKGFHIDAHGCCVDMPQLSSK